MGLMTIVCKDCAHAYGRWRPRCPACGTVNPEPMQAAVDAMTAEERTGQRGRVRMPRPPKERKPRVIKRPCVMCGLGGAKRVCLICGASMHRHCLTVHERRCKFEFVSCEDVGKEHDFIEQPGEPPVDVCNQCGKEQR